jgi:hypothetical protein
MRRQRLALCFFIDALGWEQATRHGAFETLAPHGYRQRTILGYSCAAQPTILTGTMPSEHGHWAMFYRTDRSDLASLRHLRFLPRSVTHRARVRRQFLKYHRRLSGLTGYYNLYRVPFELFGEFDVCEKRDVYAPGAFEGGVRSIFDVLSERGIAYRRWTWRTDLDVALAELEDAVVGEPDLRFALLYTARLDAFLHDHVGDVEAVADEPGPRAQAPQ